jgi:uncharacterized protein (TIGR02246 family)
MNKKLCSFKNGFAVFALIVVGVVLLDHVRGVEPTKRLAAAPVAQPASPAIVEATRGVGSPANASAGETIDAAIRKSAAAFVEAFGRGDAAALAALWTVDGEFVDSTGKRFRGPAEIEREYARFFAAHPGAKIEITIESIRPIGTDAAIEDGLASLVTDKPSAKTASPYTVVHSQVDGRWLMASVREPLAQASAELSPLDGLDWLVGSWHADKDGVRMEVDYRWIANHTFLERIYTVEQQGQVTASGVQLIGQDASHQEIQSWDFSSDAGYAVGNWIPQPDGWAIVTRGKLSDGKATAAVNYLTRVDENTVAWQSRERKADGELLPDTDEILLTRVAAGK